MKNKLTILLIIFSFQNIISRAQQYILSNEVSIFSFQTKKGKFVCLNKDKDNKYIVYRFGTKDIIEFQFPENLTNSWKEFKFSSFLRGGGIMNEGMDLNYIVFVNKNFKYVIYDNYFAVGDREEIGIRVIDTTNKKEVRIPGIRKTRKGNLVDFRDNNLLEIDEEYYD